MSLVLYFINKVTNEKSLNVGGALRAATGNSEPDVRPSEAAFHVQKSSSDRKTSSYHEANYSVSARRLLRR